MLWLPQIVWFRLESAEESGHCLVEAVVEEILNLEGGNVEMPSNMPIVSFNKLFGTEMSLKKK